MFATKNKFHFPALTGNDSFGDVFQSEQTPKLLEATLLNNSIATMSPTSQQQQQQQQQLNDEAELIYHFSQAAQLSSPPSPVPVPRTRSNFSSTSSEASMLSSCYQSPIKKSSQMSYQLTSRDFKTLAMLNQASQEQNYDILNIKSLANQKEQTGNKLNKPRVLATAPIGHKPSQQLTEQQQLFLLNRLQLENLKSLMINQNNSELAFKSNSNRQTTW